MQLRLGAAVLACALALACSAAEARQPAKQVRHDSQTASQCVETNDGRQTCSGTETLTTDHARVTARHVDKPSRAEAAAEGRFCHVPTAAGEIVIACWMKDKMAGFISDVVARGFKGRVHCFSLSHSHVAGSLHFIAEACDFAQRGWGKTVAVMYHVADLASKWGLRDGCTFRDCGHIDSGRTAAARANARRRLAMR